MFLCNVKWRKFVGKNSPDPVVLFPVLVHTSLEKKSRIFKNTGTIYQNIIFYSFHYKNKNLRDRDEEVSRFRIFAGGVCLSVSHPLTEPKK